MCNDYGNHVPYSAYVEAFSEIKVPFVAAGAAPNLEPRDDIWPTEMAPVIRRAGVMSTCGFRKYSRCAMYSPKMAPARTRFR